MASKKKIIKAATELFANYGYHKTTMDMIAEKAGLSKGSLYWHFASKDELFRAILETGFNDYFIFLEQTSNKNNLSCSQKLKAIIDYRMDFLYQHKSLAKIILSNLEGIDKEFKQRVLKARQKHEEILTEIFAQGIKNDEFKLQDPHIMAIAFIGIINSIASYKDLTKENLNRIAENLLEITLKGILKEKKEDN